MDKHVSIYWGGGGGLLLETRSSQGGNLCFVCQKVPWYFLNGNVSTF